MRVFAVIFKFAGTQNVCNVRRRRNLLLSLKTILNDIGTKYHLNTKFIVYFFKANFIQNVYKQVLANLGQTTKGIFS